MPTYLTPGVYVEEVETGSKPLSAVGTAVAAFVGVTAKADDDVEVVIQPGTAGAEGGDAPTFDLIVLHNDREEERFGGLTLGKGPRFAETVVAEQSQLIGLKVKTAEKTVAPRMGTYPIAPAATAPGEVRPSDFEGVESARTGIRGLVIADQVTMEGAAD